MCSRDCKKLGVAAIAAIVLRTGLEYLTHEVFLRPIYARPHYLQLSNTPEDIHARMPAMFLAHIIFGAAFALIYTRGYEDSKSPVGQGLRFGFWIGLLGASNALINYFVYPVSCKLAAAWAGAGMIQCLIIGAAVALIYQPQPESH